jgi:hypothetical protein
MATGLSGDSGRSRQRPDRKILENKDLQSGTDFALPCSGVLVSGTPEDGVSLSPRVFVGEERA